MKDPADLRRQHRKRQERQRGGRQDQVSQLRQRLEVGGAETGDVEGHGGVAVGGVDQREGHAVAGHRSEFAAGCRKAEVAGGRDRDGGVVQVGLVAEDEREDHRAEGDRLESSAGEIDPSELTFAENAVYSAYDHPVRLWGVTVASDQQAAGLIMKIVGGTYLWVLIALLFYRWASEHEDDNVNLRTVPSPDLTYEAVVDEFDRLGEPPREPVPGEG